MIGFVRYANNFKPPAKIFIAHFALVPLDP